MDPSQFMRMQLVQNAGIVLDESASPVTAPSAPAASDAPVDRALVREILSDLGAPDRDLEWLVASCPSVEHALAFEPTPWMLRDFGDDFPDERPRAAKGRS